MDNATQKNQQTCNPQTAMNGERQQLNASSHSIHPSSQQQTTQQQQICSHVNQHVPAQTNQQNLTHHQDNSGQNLQQTFQRRPSLNFPPQISPQQGAQYTPNNQQPPQHQTQAQVLQPIPSQPLFQQHQQSSQQNVILSPQQQLSQQHVVIQHQLMHSQQIQQPTYQQQQQVQLPQPTKMLQTPVLYSSASATNSPVKAIKKGRFRVVKGGGTEAKTASVPVANDSQSVASSHDAQGGAEKAQQPISTVKKGRFVVKKGAVASTNASSPSDNANKSGNNTIRRSSEIAKAVKKVPNEKDGTNITDGVAVEQSTTTMPSKGNDIKSDKQLAAPPLIAKSAEIENLCTKKKGRFLVKTGGGTRNLPATETKSLPVVAAGAETASKGAGDQPSAETGSKQQSPSGTKSGGVADETKCKAADVRLDQSAAKGISVVPLKGADAVAASQGVKKKGRFVVKTGAAVSSPAATKPHLSGSDGMQNAGIENANFEGMQNTGIGNVHIVQLTPPQNPPLSNFIAGNIPIPLAGMPTASLVDVNGQMMVVSNLALPLSQPAPPLPLQTIPVCQSFVTPVQNVNANVGSQQSQCKPCDSQPRLPPHIPPSPRLQVMSDQRPVENQSRPAKTHDVPRSNRPAGSSYSNWPAGSRATSSSGKNTRLIGTGGVGKVLHYLDTLRSEVVEADRSMASLQCDNRFLRDKNKELEAKISNLERQLVEERGLRHAAETNYQSLCQLRDRSQTESGTHQLEFEPTFSADGILVSLDDALENDPDRAVPNQSLTNQPVRGSFSESKLETRRSVSIEDSHPATSNATGQKQPNNKTTAGNTSVNLSHAKPPSIRPRAQTGPDSKSPLSRNNEIAKNNSSEASDAPRTHDLSQSRTGLSSIAKQFDPLGIESNSSAFHVANINHENVAIPLIVTTTQASSPPPLHPHTGDTIRCTPLVTTKKTHFDPLGTPEERNQTRPVPALVLNCLPQMHGTAKHINNGSMTVPVILPHQQQNQQEDPFDEIARMSRSHSTS